MCIYKFSKKDYFPKIFVVCIVVKISEKFKVVYLENKLFVFSHLHESNLSTLSVECLYESKNRSSILFDEEHGMPRNYI